MSVDLNFSSDIKPKTFFEELVPGIFEAFVAGQKNYEMENTQVSAQFNLTGEDGGVWTLIVQDGANLKVLPEEIEDAKMEITMSVHDWRQMLIIGAGSMDMMAMFSDPKRRMNLTHYNALKRAKGRVEMELTKDDGEVLHFSVVFNKADQTELKVMMTMQDYLEINSKNINPQQLFMQGKIKFKGDMNLAMTVASIMPR